MDEPVALAIAIPVIAMSLWGVSLTGGVANGQARVAVASELAAQAAASGAADTAVASGVADRIAVGATLDSCVNTNSSSSTVAAGGAPASSRSAAVTVVCEAPGPFADIQVCVIGYAQTRPAVSAHHRVPCPPKK
ncbi:MAG: hypothetical protein OXE79_06620 [Acidimicrobiaceae bacterium]|nr:hypothetical protein [Acidimicrobiaceae bacterium]MCY4280692.1 hypothetical protein [Acidimicrobiaceae bacterium]MCY4294406.1 hypothetical protein [Acidimicrobiaceae bacterium]